MADLTEKLGFDVSQALAALDSMDQKLATMAGCFQTLASSMGSFNSIGKATTTVFNDIAKSASSASSAVQRYTNAIAKMAAPPPMPASRIASRSRVMPAALTLCPIHIQST
jgi:hypothetical protein